MKSDLPGLDKLVKDIFDVIPAYYDESEAEKIKKLIIEYIKKLEQRP